MKRKNLSVQHPETVLVFLQLTAVSVNSPRGKNENKLECCGTTLECFL